MLAIVKHPDVFIIFHRHAHEFITTKVKRVLYITVIMTTAHV